MPRAHPIVYDALIVGSGASGSWVAKQLTEQGMRVLMLEAGPPRLPTCDFTEHVRPYQIKYRGFGNRQALIERQPIQRLCYACDEFSHQFFVDDHENPYTFPVDKPFMWIRGRQVGGKTFCWARESYRYSDYEFKAASRDGYGEDWPLSYKDLEPYYDKVESFIGVSGSREGLEQMPDGKFLPPVNLSCGGRLAREVIGKKFGWIVMPDRVANLTLAHRGRPACHYCDECQRGCYTASYFNSPSVTLPAAARTGRLTLISDAVVSHVLMNAEGKAEGVYYLERMTHAHREARAKIVVLAASALESTRILLNSRTVRFPEGLGNSSGQLGHYLMDHFTLEGAGGFLPQFKSSRREPRGTPCGFLIPKYVNTGSHVNKNFVRGYRFDGDGSQELYEHAMAKAMRNDVLEILDAMKLQDPQPPREALSVFGKNIHECGTVRMGKDPKKSVVNSFGQLHDAKNVFVSDGAVFVTQGCYEPTLTIMAISARSADYIADESSKGSL